MKVLLVGSTGATGKLALEKLLAAGHEVTAFARTPSSIGVKNDRLKIAQGDARDADALDRAVAGQDAVLSVLGPRSLKKDDLQEVYMRNLVGAMQKAGVKRLVNLSAFGAGESRAVAPFFMKVLSSTILRNVYADKNRGEVRLFASGLDFVNVRPGQLLNKPARGNVRASKDATGLDPTKITRDDLATFMVAQLTDSTWVRQSPIVGYPR